MEKVCQKCDETFEGWVDWCPGCLLANGVEEEEPHEGYDDYEEEPYYVPPETTT